MGNRSYTKRQYIAGSAILSNDMPGCGEFNSPGEYVFLGQFTRTGQNVPKFRDLVKRSLNASGQMDVSVSFLKNFTPGSQSVDYIENCVPGNVFTPYPVRKLLTVSGAKSLDDAPLPLVSHQGLGDTVDLATNQAISKLYRELDRAHHTFMGGVFLGQFKKTAQMIAGASKAIRRGVFDYLGQAFSLRGSKSRLRTLKPKARKALNVRLSNLWLEYVFGWQPLLMDVHDGAEALMKMSENAPPVRFRAFAAAEMQVSGTSGSYNTNGCVWLKNQFVRRNTRVVFYGALRAPLDGLGSSNPLVRLATLSGFDLSSFLPTLWELLPWSFFVDYFINVGDLFTALSTDTRMVAWITKVVIDDSDVINHNIPLLSQTLKDFSGITNRTVISVSGSAGSYENTFRTISRLPTVVPCLLPQFNIGNFGFRKLANTAALILANRSR